MQGPLHLNMEMKYRDHLPWRGQRVNDNSNIANNTYINLNNRVKNTIENQDKLENESLNKKKILVISSKIKELENLLKK